MGNTAFFRRVAKIFRLYGFVQNRNVDVTVQLMHFSYMAPLTVNRGQSIAGILGQRPNWFLYI